MKKKKIRAGQLDNLHIQELDDGSLQDIVGGSTNWFGCENPIDCSESSNFIGCQNPKVCLYEN
jgi:hypothetical protein